jgi:hypothetical protein
MIAIVLALILSIPLKLAGVAVESVDCIELNHFHDKRGCHVYDQVIFYERCVETGRLQVRSWCLVEDREHLNRRPVKNELTGVYRVEWYDSDKRMSRTITSRLFRESWTQVDPERENKKFLDERLRVSLVSRIPERVSE